MYGVYLSLSFPEDKEAREERPRITDCLSMRCSGFFAQEPLGAIFLQSTVTGKIPIAVFVVGVTKIWEKILSHLMDMPDFKWLLIDSTYCKAHPHAAGAKGGSEAPGRTKGGSTPGYIWP